MADHLKAARGIARSCRIYYGDRDRSARMDALYRRFISPGALVFDIGSHVGDRIASFRRLGARVIAVEPQPAAAAFLRLAYGWRRNVTVIQAAIGRAEGLLDLHINLSNPTISTGSAAFIAAAGEAPGWHDQKWDRQQSVPLLTLDSLIAREGCPGFIKIDVEGFEAEVLAGLKTPVPALSFEFTTIQRDVAEACLARLMDLGSYRFNAALGENHRMEFAEPIDGGAMRNWLGGLPHQANSGDIYAVLNSGDPAAGGAEQRP
ncbi:hypothetical protein GCM10007276_13970 [Agaricicola taiwanensis]|uniref:Methyltransferase FkbM domain-containing protein n=1 Tax=Agaricicola taiwanensis TaxID=591372 RepID=A0A8J2VSY4_9RHOB|nr:hypothetical protein GCM10007276_13970 [Agaricicola taiwanensis]